jgi:hypothetical protein
VNYDMTPIERGAKLVHLYREINPNAGESHEEELMAIIADLKHFASWVAADWTRVARSMK